MNMFGKVQMLNRECEAEFPSLGQQCRTVR